MSMIEDLRSVRGLFAECPSCGKNLALREANLFDATKPLPQIAIEYLQTKRIEMACEITAVRQERAELKRRSFTSAATSGFGQIVETLSPVIAWISSLLLRLSGALATNRLYRLQGFEYDGRSRSVGLYRS